MNPASSHSSQEDLVAREGVGLGMDMSVTPPPDPANWKRCPDCGMWSKGRERRSCANCGYLFGQEGSALPAAALDAATLQAAKNLVNVAGGVENARVAVDRLAETKSQ